MKIANPITFLQSVEFHKYNAKSNGESLLIHSFNVYFLAQKISRYMTGLTPNDIAKIEIASLLHDYGKTYPEFQSKLYGPHKLKDGDIQSIKDSISREVNGLDNSDIEDIIYIIQNHHSVNLEKANSDRGRLTRIVSICDTAVSNDELTQNTINSLYGLVDSVEYELLAVELIEHPISSYVIGAFDFVYKSNGIEPILFTKDGTLFIKKKDQSLPPLLDVNKFLNAQITSLTFEGGGVILNNTNNRIYRNPEDFLRLVSQLDKFVEEVTQEVNRRLAAFKKYQKDKWTEEAEKIYLYGRVCGWVHDSIIDILKEKFRQKSNEPKGDDKSNWKDKLGKINKEKLTPKGGGGFADKTTVKFIQDKYGEGKSYTLVLRSILEIFSSDIKDAMDEENYDTKDLLVNDTVLNSQSEIDVQEHAKKDYNKYWNRDPTNVCRVCHNFNQIKTTAALFPTSELGGKTDVFYTDLMRRSPELKEGGGICKWCLLWFILLKTKTGNRIYKLCIHPHGVFGRIDWDDIFDPDQIIRIGISRENYIYPHVAITGLSGQNYSSFISQVVRNNGNGDSILQKLYENGLRSKVISTMIEPSTRLFECGGVSIDSAEYDLLRIVIENVIASRTTNNFSLVIRAMKQKDKRGKDFPYAWGTLIKTNKLKEEKDMIKELGEKTGLSFLGAVWIDGSGDIKVSNAEKVVRRVNETLRKLKDTESKDVIIDAMVAVGLKVAISTRDFKTWQDERRQAEIDAFKRMAEKLYEYKDNSAQRTELVRSMAYYLAYVS
ncbi:MAG: hypothetical protein DDT42_01326 [candidate division WS2 bacterium]|uniref:HD/PDEase domain-containing protein n=1 Tax=Psychracetigena formicireducens TaxID=2986056 RepID=A0A9E2F6L4_PSYF1|nr:hypothetical protein [Candidatus Psychracetigena formicireducens]